MRKALLTATAVCALAGAGFAVASLSATKTVNIRSTGFAPRTVTIAGGDTVQWKNVDTVNHQVVANNGSFASGLITPNKTYSKRIDIPGTYGYRDALHPTLRGTVKGDREPAGGLDRRVDRDHGRRESDPRRRRDLARGRGRHRHHLGAAVRPGLVREGARRADDDERRLRLHHVAADPDHVQGDLEGQDERSDQCCRLASLDAVARLAAGSSPVLSRPRSPSPAALSTSSA